MNICKLNAVFPRLMALLLLTAFARPLLAAENAGVILALKGKVEVLHEKKTLSAVRLAKLFSGDTIVTGAGQVQIRFADGTMLTLYHDTRFAVKDYQYGKGKSDRAQFSLVNGLMHTLTGKINKKSYQISTRFANLGIRGTEYSVSLGDTLHVSVDAGQVSIANAAGTLLVNAGGSAIVTGLNEIPRLGGGRINLQGGPGGHGGHGGRGGAGGGGGGAGGAGGPAGGGAAAPPPAPPGTRSF